MKIILYLSFIFLPFYTKAQNGDSLLVTNKEIQKFLTDLRIAEKPGKHFIVIPEIHPNLSMLLIKNLIATDTTLFPNGLNFLEAQSKTGDNITKWNSSLIDSAMIIDKKTILEYLEKNKSDGHLGWYSFHKTYGRSYYELSLPYFSMDLKTSLIFVSNRCGLACGEYGYRVYKKQNGRWVFYKSYWKKTG
jgi:hypothetical protein